MKTDFLYSYIYEKSTLISIIQVTITISYEVYIRSIFDDYTSNQQF